MLIMKSLCNTAELKPFTHTLTNLKLKTFFIFLILNACMINTQTVFDSYLNTYKTKEQEFEKHIYKDVANTTWREFYVTENITNLNKVVPAYLDNDKELDLIILETNSKLYWISNIRGTSKKIEHNKISDKSLKDFIAVDPEINSYYDHQDFFILGINSRQDKIYKYKIKDSKHQLNRTLAWSEELIFDLQNKSLLHYKYIKDSEIISFNLMPVANEKKKHILLLNLYQYGELRTDILKMNLIDSEIDFRNIDLIKLNKNAHIIGAYDMNKDGLVDIIYSDANFNVFILLNDDPYFSNIFVSTISPVLRGNKPRLFIFDADNDGYPDIITADQSQNNIGILFNNGREYWKKVSAFFRNQKREIQIVYRETIWSFIPLIDANEEEINEQGLVLKDFTILKTLSAKRLNFEIFAIYSDKLFWFVEKEVNLPNFPVKENNGNNPNELQSSEINWGSHKTFQNYIFSMVKCEIVIENSLFAKEDFTMITEINVNYDSFPEFIIYSEKYSTLFWIKKYIGYISGFGWDSNFWIYLMIYIYIACSIVGVYRFWILKNLKEEKESKKLNFNEVIPQSINMNEFNSS